VGEMDWAVHTLVEFLCPVFFFFLETPDVYGIVELDGAANIGEVFVSLVEIYKGDVEEISDCGLWDECVSRTEELISPPCHEYSLPAEGSCEDTAVLEFLS